MFQSKCYESVLMKIISFVSHVDKTRDQIWSKIINFKIILVPIYLTASKENNK